MGLPFAAVADDDTGATDLAGMLAERGMRAILLLDQPSPEDFDRWTQDADAVVIGTASRSVHPAEAYRRTRQAVSVLESSQPEVLAIKYCSTFDSTESGNIGPSIDAALDETGAEFTIALPALPVNARTTYMGYHFVGRQLLSDSSMRNHPLNPMTNPNLVTHLQSQTKRRIGLLAFPEVQEGPSRVQSRLRELAAEGIGIAVLDCTSDRDLEILSRGIADLPLVTGSSALGICLPLSWERKAPRPLSATSGISGRGFLIVAGSYSEATRRQNEWLARNGATVVTFDALKLATDGDVETPARACEALRTDGVCLLQLSRNREEVHAFFQESGATEVEAGERIAAGLARIVQNIVSAATPKGLVLAGGETASTIARVLQFRALRVGKNIEPGVPLCVTLSESPVPVVFKSGNFGSDDFYGRAVDAIASLSLQ
ncbi:MAG: 3-oxo-tetronate kinase [Bryobacteraceae bacterium]